MTNILYCSGACRNARLDGSLLWVLGVHSTAEFLDFLVSQLREVLSRLCYFFTYGDADTAPPAHAIQAEITLLCRGASCNCRISVIRRSRMGVVKHRV